MLKEINQRRIRYFHEVLVRGTIRGAAEQLNVAASVITRQLRLLEEELAVTLFERRARGVVPTEAADVVLQYYRQCNASQEYMESCLQEMRGMQRGSIRIGVNEAYVPPLMDDVLNDFSQQYPRLNIHVEVLLTAEIIAQVIQDEMHIGLAYNPPENPDIHCYLRAKRPIRLLARKGHPLINQQRKIVIADVMDYPLGLMSATSGVAQTIQLLEATEKIRLAPILTTNSVLVLQEFIRGGGLAFLAPAMTNPKILSGEVIALEIDHPILTAPEIHLFVKQGRPLSAAINQLLKQAETKLSLFN